MSWNWRKKRTYIVDHFLPASVLWEVAREQGKSHAELGESIGRSAYTVQSTLAGKNNLPWDRAFWFAQHLGLSRLDFIHRVDQLELKLAAELDDLHKWFEFPQSPPKKTERLVMAYHIQDRLCGRGWEEIFGPDVVTSDMMWRARVRKFGSVSAAAREFGVAHGTVVHWEKANVPQRRWQQARDIYGRYL